MLLNGSDARSCAKTLNLPLRRGLGGHLLWSRENGSGANSRRRCGEILILSFRCIDGGGGHENERLCVRHCRGVIGYVDFCAETGENVELTASASGLLDVLSSDGVSSVELNLVTVLQIEVPFTVSLPAA